MRGNELGVLIRGITANVNIFISSKVEKHGIKQGQYEYFLLIFSIPGINQLELARLKNVGKASVTKALKILEDNGFVRRETDENDRRNTLCYITEKGEKIVDDLMGIKTKAEEELFKGFKNEDIEVFYKYLMLLNQNSKALVVDIE
jgi:DNA-binding MarR family transcriptional regulator